MKIYLISLLLALAGCSLFNTDHYITTPSDRQNVAGVQTVNVTPPANFNADSVKFYIDNAYKTIVNSSPYTYQWDTRGGYTNGPHLISVEIDSVSGGTFLTDSITVFVGN